MRPNYQSFIAKVTLFFFTHLVCYSPVYAQTTSSSFDVSIAGKTTNIPVIYVTSDQVVDIIRETRLRGYTIKEGTFLQLTELEQGTPNQEASTEKEIPCDPDKKINDEKSSAGCATVGETKAPKPMKVEVPAADPAPYPVPEPLPPPEPPPQPVVQTNIGLHADVSYGGGRGGNIRVQANVGLNHWLWRRLRGR